jgi:hypothetical protein
MRRTSEDVARGVADPGDVVCRAQFREWGFMGLSVKKLSQVFTMICFFTSVNQRLSFDSP